MWRHRRIQDQVAQQAFKASMEARRIATAIERRTEVTVDGRRHKSRSNLRRGTVRLTALKEKVKLFHDAYWDVLDSPGEIDALTSSELLHVERGDVISDPKLHGYRHPGLRAAWKEIPLPLHADKHAKRGHRPSEGAEAQTNEPPRQDDSVKAHPEAAWLHRKLFDKTFHGRRS